MSQHSPSQSSPPANSPQNASLHALVPRNGAGAVQLAPVAVAVAALPIAAVSPMNGLSRPITLPPRAKPGRKPNTTPAASQKAAANRRAQQKHREKKKAEKEKEIEAEKEEAKRVNALLAENTRLSFQMKDAERRANHFERLYMERSTPSTPSVEVAASPLSSAAPTTPITSTQPSAPPAPPSPVTQIPPASPPPDTVGKPVVGGCGGCVEGGACPCVDSLINTDYDPEPSVIKSTEPLNESRKRQSSATGRRSPPKLVPIHSLLSSPKRQKVDHYAPAPSPSHTDIEIDFTAAFRSHDPIMPNVVSPNSCGACPPDDEGSCLCRKASWIVGGREDQADDASDTSTAVPSRANSASASGPGSCARCQADPQQRAWCQGLAQQTLKSRNVDADDRAPQPKGHIYNEMISCSEAYAVHQRYTEPSSSKPRQVTRRQHKARTSVSAEDVLSTVKELPREFSAFEVDIGTVLSNLKHSGGR